MKKTILVGLALTVAAVMGTSAQTQALHGTETPDHNATSTADDTRREEVRTTDIASREAERRLELDAKRQALEQKVAERRAAIAEKLSGARAESCEKKQTAINRILDNRTDAAQRHYDRFKSIQDRLVSFVDSKELNVENASALEVIMEDKQVAAQGAIDAVTAAEFTCKDADARSPGTIIIDQIAAAKQALKEYRTAIKDYAVAVKSAAQTVPSQDESTEGAE